MLTKKEGKWRLSVTSVWFFILMPISMTQSILLKGWDWEILGVVGICLYFALLNPAKKYSGIIHMVFSVLTLLMVYEYSQVAAFGAYSLYTILFNFFMTLLIFSLALLGLAQFSDRPERWLKLKYIPTVSIIAAALLFQVTRLLAGGFVATFSSWSLCANFLLNLAEQIVMVIAFYQLSVKYCEAARNKMAEEAEKQSALEADPSCSAEPPKKRSTFKKVVKSALLLAAAFAFISSAYHCTVAVFADDPVITVNGETYTVVKNPPKFTITIQGVARKNQLKQAILDDVNTKHQSNWPFNFYSPKVALEYGITVLNDFFPTWTYDNQVRLIMDDDQGIWCIYGQVEDQDPFQRVGSVMFDSITGEVLRIDFLSFVYE